MAGKRKRKNTHLQLRGGIWHAWFYDRNHKRVRFSTGCTDEDAAAKVLEQRELLEAQAASAGLSTDATGKVVADATYHLAVEAHTNSRGDAIPESTRNMYRTKGGHLDRLLGDIELTKLKRSDVQRYISARENEGAARGTVKKELCTLAAALKQAAELGWVPHAAAIECVPKYKAKSKARVRYLAEEEFPKLLAALDTSEWFAQRLPRLHDPELSARKLAEHRRHVLDRQLFVMIGALAGAELGAMNRLAWSDIDFAAMTIRVPGTKTEFRDRTIDLDPQLAAALSRVPAAERTGLVLRPWANAVHDLKVAAKRAGIAPLNVHALRHTFGAWLVQRGVSTFVVGRLMGHKDSSMVEEFYGHLKPTPWRSCPGSRSCSRRRSCPVQRSSAVSPVCQTRRRPLARMTSQTSAAGVRV